MLKEYFLVNLIVFNHYCKVLTNIFRPMEHSLNSLKKEKQ